jgi:predicted Fe-S protein YdhL (DUF1289 family)
MTTYYFKDRDSANRTIYWLVSGGVRSGCVRTKKEAEAWYRAQNLKGE